MPRWFLAARNGVAAISSDDCLCGGFPAVMFAATAWQCEHFLAKRDNRR